MNNQRNKIALIISIILLQVGSFTDTFGQQIKAKMQSSGNQYQTILIPQEFRAIIGNDISKIRIKDAKGKEVPYILEERKVSSQTFNAIPFERTRTDSSEVIFIQNSSKIKQSSLTFKIANSTVSKNYTIEGSQDGTNWFSLANNEILADLQDPSETFVLKTISFPLNDYAFIRIVINNKKSAPINILEIGKIKVIDIEQQYEKIKGVSFNTNENVAEKTTDVKIDKNGHIPFDIISIHVTKPPLFSREAQLYVKNESNNKKKNNNSIFEGLHFDLRNDNAKHIDVQSLFYPDTFFLKINNKDNQPLKIDSISLYQIPIRLIAQLKETENYTLEADTTWITPDYDLNKFNLQLPNTLDQAKISSIELVKTSDKTNDKSQGKIILIIGSIIGAFVVLYFGNSLLKDMKKNKDN